MKRTGEKVLSIIADVLNVLSVGFLILMLISSNKLLEDPLFKSEIESSMYDSSLTDTEIQQGFVFLDDFFLFMTSIGWIFVVLGIVSIILGIVGAIKVNENPKLAGILFIIAGVLSGIISIPGILLIIAAIMCFVRKPKIETPIQRTDENGYVIE